MAVAVAVAKRVFIGDRYRLIICEKSGKCGAGVLFIFRTFPGEDRTLTRLAQEFVSVNTKTV